MQKKTIALFWRLTKGHELQRNLALLFPMLAVITNAIIAPFVLSQFVNSLQAGGITLAGSWQLIALYAALVFCGEVVLWRLALYFTWTFQVNGAREIYLLVFNKLSRESLSFHSNRFGGSLVSQSNKLMGAFDRFWEVIVWSMVPMLTTIIGSIVTLILIGVWQYALFLVFYSIIFGTIRFRT